MSKEWSCKIVLNEIANYFKLSYVVLKNNIDDTWTFRGKPLYNIGKHQRIRQGTLAGRLRLLRQNTNLPYTICKYMILKPSQNKKGKKIFQLHRFLNTFSQLPAVKSIQKNGAAGKFFGSSYFDLALVIYCNIVCSINYLREQQFLCLFLLTFFC